MVFGEGQIVPPHIFEVGLKVNTKVYHRVFAEQTPALVEKACSQFRIRIEAVIEAEGGYIE